MFLSEGGSAPGVGPIHKDEIEATLAPLGKALGINLIDNMLGSAGKKQFSGDIDVAVQVNPDDIAEFGKKVQESPFTLYFAKTSVFITKVKIQNNIELCSKNKITIIYQKYSMYRILPIKPSL